MRLLDAERELLQRLEAAGLSPSSLDPWEAWKVFKAYLRLPVEDEVYDAAAFQCDRIDGVHDYPFSAYFVRQFSRWEGRDDAGIRRVVMEFSYESAPSVSAPSLEVWTHDFPTLEEFSSVIEAQPQFQAVVNKQPDYTEVFNEEI